MTTFLSYYYDALEETLTHTNSLKLNSYPVENVTDFFAAILVDAKLLESAGDSKPEHLGYITSTFEDTSDHIFRIWTIQKYKNVTEFIKKLRLCDLDVISPEEIITYDSFVQEATSKYYDHVNPKRWETATGKEKSQDKLSLMKA